jgi:exodeoxyribonuclease-3
MRVSSWNVNGLRAAAGKGFLDWLGRCDCDVVALQEVRAHADQLPPEVRAPPSWHTVYHSARKPGYSGVALFSRRPPDEIRTTLHEDRFDGEGRVQIARFGRLWLVNGYFPNGNGTLLRNGQRSNDRVPFKLDFYRAVRAAVQPQFARGEPILVLGDWNTAPEAIDLARPKENQKTSGFLPEEREEVRTWLRDGWCDTFRHFHPDATGAYSWWSQRWGVRQKNIGWRIDLALASPGLVPALRGASIQPDVMGSDHCPIAVALDPVVAT